MKNLNKNKMLGGGILLGIILVLIILNFLNSRSNSTSITKNDSTLPGTPQKQLSQKELSQKQLNDPQSMPVPPLEKNTQPTSPTPTTAVAPANSPQTGAPGLPIVSAIPTTPIPSANLPQLPDTSGVKPDPSKNAKTANTTIADGCFNLTFVHKKLASHQDGEACLLHKNLIVLSHPDQAKKSKIDPKSICMRINDKAVKHSFVPGKPEQVILGSEAGPNAKITASYCVGKSKCALSCVPEKDQFLSAIGADEEGDHAQAVGWDGQKGKSQEDTEVDNQMTALNQDLSSDGGDNSQMFGGWILETQNAQCEQPHSSGKKIAQAKGK